MSLHCFYQFSPLFPPRFLKGLEGRCGEGCAQCWQSRSQSFPGREDAVSSPYPDTSRPISQGLERCLPSMFPWLPGCQQCLRAPAAARSQQRCWFPWQHGEVRHAANSASPSLPAAGQGARGAILPVPAAAVSSNGLRTRGSLLLPLKLH